MDRYPGFSLRRLQMEVLVAVGAWALSSVCQSLPHDSGMRSLLCDRGILDYDLSPLLPKLSAAASVIYPNDTTAFDLATSRWSSYETPTISVVVVPGTENDVAETVCGSESLLDLSRQTTYLCTGEICDRTQHTVPGRQRRPWRHQHSREDAERNRDLDEPVADRRDCRGRGNGHHRWWCVVHKCHASSLGRGKADRWVNDIKTCK